VARTRCFVSVENLERLVAIWDLAKIKVQLDEIGLGW
jgi:hypothetical protein